MRPKVLSWAAFAAALFTASSAAAHPSDDFTELKIFGDTNGNHDLSCTLIVPWGSGEGPVTTEDYYPVVAWLNGWDQGNVIGQTTIQGYLPGLIEIAVDLEMVVIAANQWSPRDVDVIRCIEWLVQESDIADYVDPDALGLMGHSQGGGGVLRAGDQSAPGSYSIQTVVAMNPFGPKWAKIGSQDGPVLLLGGSEDTTTPTTSFEAVWDAVQSNGQGGMLAELDGGTHNSEAWTAEDDPDNPQNYNFGAYQALVEAWFAYYLDGDAAALADLQDFAELPQAAFPDFDALRVDCAIADPCP